MKPNRNMIAPARRPVITDSIFQPHSRHFFQSRFRFAIKQTLFIFFQIIRIWALFLAMICSIFFSSLSKKLRDGSFKCLYFSSGVCAREFTKDEERRHTRHPQIYMIINVCVYLYMIIGRTCLKTKVFENECQAFRIQSEIQEIQTWGYEGFFNRFRRVLIFLKSIKKWWQKQAYGF